MPDSDDRLDFSAMLPCLPSWAPKRPAFICALLTEDLVAAYPSWAEAANVPLGGFAAVLHDPDGEPIVLHGEVKPAIVDASNRGLVVTCVRLVGQAVVAAAQMREQDGEGPLVDLFARLARRGDRNVPVRYADVASLYERFSGRCIAEELALKELRDLANRSQSPLKDKLDSARTWTEIYFSEHDWEPWLDRERVLKFILDDLYIAKTLLIEEQ